MLLAMLVLPLAQRAQQPRTFGGGIPSLTLQLGKEVPIFNHTLSPGSVIGVLNHLWSVGGGHAEAPELDGVQVYRFYIDGEREASVEFPMRMAAGIVFDPVIADKRDIPPLPHGDRLLHPHPVGVNSSGIPVSAPTPWGTEWLGKGSDMEGYYNNFRVPFGRSLLVTVELPAWAKHSVGVWTIVRGEENVPLTLGGRALPPSARLRTHANAALFVSDMGFTPLVNRTTGSGVVLGHTLGIEMARNPHINPLGFLEGCFHLITPHAGVGASPQQQQYGVGAGFPGVVLSTGMEDYYDSSFYFHAGIFQNPVSGITHLCDYPLNAYDEPAHPPCPGNTSRWSGYRLHYQVGDRSQSDFACCSPPD